MKRGKLYRAYLRAISKLGYGTPPKQSAQAQVGYRDRRFVQQKALKTLLLVKPKTFGGSSIQSGRSKPTAPVRRKKKVVKVGQAQEREQEPVAAIAAVVGGSTAMSNETKTTGSQSNRELLVGLSTDMAWVKQILNEHLAHHRKLLYAGVALISTLLAGLALSLIP